MDSDEFATHGRYLEVDTAGMTVASLYIQTGEADTPRQSEKERCGDWNIAHTENDIKNWKGNVKKSGFLPSERAWLTDILASGWVDVVRVLHPDVAGPYAWWSWRGRAFDNDAGWRIDYQSPSQAGGAPRRPPGSRREPYPPGSSGPRPMRCAGPTMPRSPSNIHLLWTVSGAHDR